MLQQLIQNRWNFKVVILFVALYGAAAFAMNIPVVEEDSQSEKTIRIFNPEEALRNGRPWSKVVPRNILITPDGKGALMAECQGRVRYVSFDPHHSEVIIDHCRDVEFYPIIATAQKEDGSLLVVSAGNYNINMQGSAERIIFCNKTFTTKKINRSVQAMALDSLGKTLVMADTTIAWNDIVAVDLHTGKECRMPFNKMNRVEQTYFDWVVDVAVNTEGNLVVVADRQGEVQLMSLLRTDDSIELSKKRSIKTNDSIGKMYFSYDNQLLYSNEHNEVKTIVIEDIVNSENQHVNSSVIMSSKSYNNVAIDQGGSCAAAYWGNDTKSEVLYKITISHKSGQDVPEEFVFEPLVKKDYFYINESGQKRSGIGHVLDVILRGKQVIALATDGKLRLWSIDTTKEDFYKKLAELQITLSAEKEIAAPLVKEGSGSLFRRKRGSSSSSADKPRLVNSTPDIMDKRHQLLNSTSDIDKATRLVSSTPDLLETPKQKKPSPRPLVNLMKAHSSGSREGSPSPSASRGNSAQNSPQTSPHRENSPHRPEVKPTIQEDKI